MHLSQRSEPAALGFALFAATTMIAQQVAGKATRDALFLSNFDVTNLPKVVIAAAIASMAGVLLMSRLLSRISPATLVPAVFGLSALLFLVEWSLIEYQPGVISIILYLHMAVFGAVLISGFWSVINERFDPHSAKQRVARIAAAATLGGVVGGVLAERVSALLDVRSMLLFLSGLHIVCLLAVRAIGAPVRSVHTGTEVEPRSAFTVIARTPYLQWMALFTLLVAVVAVLLDYALKAEASARYRDSESLVAFFASFYAVIGVFSFGVQTLLGRRVLQQFGIGITMAVLPATVALFGIIGSAFTQLWSIVMLRGGQAVLVNSFHRSAFELLYTPLPPHKKRPTKSIIDVASDRLGDMIGSGLLLVLLFLLPDLPTALVTLCAVALALLALFVVTRLNRGYINQLAQNLRRGVVRIDENEIVDATTQQILAESIARSEREFLDSRISAMRARKAENDLEDSYPPDEKFCLVHALQDLCSGDTQRIRRALSSNTLDIRLTPYLIPLLGHEEMSQDIRTELRWQVPRIVGQLTDALLDPEQPLVVRQRLPGVLEASHNPRCIAGLLLGMTDSAFGVRYSCARTLARMRTRNLGLKVPREQVYSAIHHEFGIPRTQWEHNDRHLEAERNAGGQAGGPRIGRSLEHVFTLLALILDHDAVQIARQAVFSNNAILRGTALEYLENVLPADLYNALLERIGASEEARNSTRALGDILDELRSVFHTVNRRAPD